MKDLKQKQIDKIVRIARTDDSADAPDFAIKYARNVFLGRVAEPKPSLLRRIVAVLTAEIASGVPAFGERSASASSERQLLFQAGDVAVDMRISGAEARTIRGQILGGEAPASVLLSINGVGRTAQVSEFNSFTFEGLAAGKTLVTLRFAESEVVIEIPGK